MDYPKARVITATTPLATPIPTTLRGPRNHRHVTIPSLTALPFPSNHFDVVSARFLFLQLRVSDFDPCLSECLRVLKPGGFLEFTVIDHDIINAGPLAEELVGKFADRLRNDQRDPEPSRRWIKRLDDAGFEDVKRMWMVLPMAAAPVKPGTTNSGQRPGSSGTITASTPASAVTEPTSAISRRVDPVQEDLRRRMKVWEGLTDDENNDDQDRDDDDDDENCGSTKDIAGITGLIGGWCWEKWVHGMGLKEEEMVGKVMDEAKGYGSGWRCLMGYARKPLGMISPPGAAEGDAQQAASAVEAEDADDVDDV